MDRKRLLDLALTLPALPVIIPIVATCAAAVRLIDGSPVFFVQPRLGRHRRTFPLFKLRTMVTDAALQGAQVTAGGDRRITRLGRVLRQWKLDELPQLANVLRGEMSLVGPRPEVERYVRHYRPEWEPVFEARPGVTDEVSLVFRNEQALLAGIADPERAYVEVVMPAKVELALQAARRQSVTYDLTILVRTVGAVLGIVRDDAHPVLCAVREQLEHRGKASGRRARKVKVPKHR